MKRTIEDITETRTFYKRSRDAFGNGVKEPYEKTVKRKVNVVTGWLRFGHYVIDGLIIGALNLLIDSILIQTIGYRATVRTMSAEGMVYNLIPAFDDILIVVAYYFICEYSMQRTIGKFATDCVVVNQYAENPDSSSLMGRSFARIVPFEAFSCLGDRGWHDKWSKTYVVTTKERDQLKKLLDEQEGFVLDDNEDILD